MAESSEREAASLPKPRDGGHHLIYRRPYEDQWGALHDPTTWWDELLKYYRHDVTLLVSQACRRMAQPADVGAMRLIRQGEKRHQHNLERAHQLEARYLQHRDHQRRRRKPQTRRVSLRQRARTRARAQQ